MRVYYITKGRTEVLQRVARECTANSVEGRLLHTSNTVVLHLGTNVTVIHNPGLVEVGAVEASHGEVCILRRHELVYQSLVAACSLTPDAGT